MKLVRSAACACALASLLVALAACGGGTDVAPSQPVVSGNGSATVRLVSTGLGQTTRVVAGVARAQGSPASAVGEQVTFDANGFAVLSHPQLSTPIITLTGPPPARTPVYAEGNNSTCVTDVPPCDYWVQDQNDSVLQARAGGPLTSATAYADYSYNERLLSISVGISYANGQLVSLTFWHIPVSATAPLSITTVSDTAPPPPYPMAFTAQVQTNLTTADQRDTYLALDDPANLASITRIDLTNESQPCLAGDVTVMVKSNATGAIVPLTLSFQTPGC